MCTICFCQCLEGLSVDHMIGLSVSWFFSRTGKLKSGWLRRIDI